MKRFAWVCAGVTAMAIVTVPAGSRCGEAGWKTRLALGGNLTRGNGETALGTLDLTTERAAGEHEFHAGAQGAYGENDGKTTRDNARVFAEYRRLVGAFSYGYVKGELGYDDIAGVDRRLIAGPGVGRYLVKRPAHVLSVELGASYLEEKVREGAETGVSGTRTDEKAVARAAKRYEWTPGPGTRVWDSLEYLGEFDDPEDYLLTAEVGAEAALNTHLSFRVTVRDRYDSEPPSGSENNDVAVTVSLVFGLGG